jgi:hypothetical protein
MQLRSGLWIAGLAFAAALGVGAALILRGGGGDQSGPVDICDRPLSPIGGGSVTSADFDAAIAGIDSVIEFSRDNNHDAANEQFFLNAHDFTHNVDGPLREKDQGLAKELCRAVAQIEGSLSFREPPSTVADQAEGIRDLIQRARDKLDL